MDVMDVVPASDVQERVRAAKEAAAYVRQRVIPSAKAPESSVTQFVKDGREALAGQIKACEHQLSLLNDLASMTDPQKMDMLFEVMDGNRDGGVDVSELASGLKRVVPGMSFGQSWETAMDSIPEFDKDGDGNLNRTEFGEFIEELAASAGVTFHEMSEFLIMQELLTGEPFDEDEVSAAEVLLGPARRRILELEALRDGLADERMARLFRLFGAKGNLQSATLGFKEIAIGLVKMTGVGLGEAENAAVGAILQYSGDANERTLNFNEFTNLVLKIIAASPGGLSFSEIADTMLDMEAETLALSTSELEELERFEKNFEKKLEDEKVAREEAEVEDAIKYSRLVRLFELWDLDVDGFIDFGELVLGLRRFQQTTSMERTMTEAILLMNDFDSNRDAMLGIRDFAKFLTAYAHKISANLDDLIDELIVYTALRGDDATEKLYIESVKAQATRDVKRVEHIADAVRDASALI